MTIKEFTDELTSHAKEIDQLMKRMLPVIPTFTLKKIFDDFSGQNQPS